MDNKELKEMFKKDQNARAGNEINWEVLNKEDKKRRERVNELWEKGKIVTAADYYHAAMVMQHGENVEEYEFANKLAEKSMELNEPRAPWLYAASLDRWTLARGEEFQKFGTQFKKGENGPWYLCPVDPKTTDRERAKYNVPPLEKQKEKAKELNS